MHYYSVCFIVLLLHLLLCSCTTATTVKLADADLNKFVKGDYITNNATTPVTAQITKVSTDFSTLTVAGMN